MITIVILTIGGDRNIRDEERKKSMLKFRSKLKYYPLVIIGLWLIPSFDQIASYTYDSLSITSQVLSFSHIVAFSLQGMANFFLYGLGYIRKSFVNKKEKINMEKSSMKDQCITYLDEKNEDRSREVSGESSVPSIEN